MYKLFCPLLGVPGIGVVISWDLLHFCWLVTSQAAKMPKPVSMHAHIFLFWVLLDDWFYMAWFWPLRDRGSHVMLELLILEKKNWLSVFARSFCSAGKAKHHIGVCLSVKKKSVYHALLLLEPHAFRGTLVNTRVLTKVLKWWVPGLITFENGESHQILVSPHPKMMSPDFSYNKPLSESLIFHKSWVHAVSFKCIYKLK